MGTRLHGRTLSPDVTNTEVSCVPRRLGGPPLMEWLLPVGGGFLLTVLALGLRIALVLRGPGDHKPGRRGHVSLLVVAGSGGHTTEILRLLSVLSTSYYPIHYVLAETDKMSEEKIHSFETSKEKTSTEPKYTIHRIPRSREVRQSWSSSFLTTLQSLFYSLPLTFRLKPDVCLDNSSKLLLDCLSFCHHLLLPNPARMFSLCVLQSKNT
ncbi:UDP-N-acetylglucosamine transferase subunit ALG14 isoform X2 [Dendrobates tinctorius]|uniref:UDP-N-acetylglucosamine transferase subunit ALG14 isoform X2 n=1 Tax=Dendrobates tinctorius TaxID=92724 RepID=UPI003CCA23E0